MDPPLLKFDDPLDNLDSLGSHLSQVLHDRLDRFQRRKEFKMANESNAPLSVALLFHYLTDLVKLSRSKSKGTLPTFNNFQKLELRGTFFQHRNIFFTFPPDNSPVPYANYHALTGKKVFILDWHFAFPNVDLTCPACGSGRLSAHRTQFSHNWKLFPLINSDGTTSWGSVMRYNCSACDKKTPANDPKLLLSLPPHMRQCYPVEPRYANGAFHLTQQASDELDAVMLTYGNGDFFSRKLYQTASRNYLRAVENYLSIVPHSHKGGHAYHLDLHEWLGRLPPTGESIRECYLMAENSRKHCLRLQPLGPLQKRTSVCGSQSQFRCMLHRLDIRNGQNIQWLTCQSMLHDENRHWQNSGRVSGSFDFGQGRRSCSATIGAQATIQSNHSLHRHLAFWKGILAWSLWKRNTRKIGSFPRHAPNQQHFREG